MIKFITSTIDSIITKSHVKFLNAEYLDYEGGGDGDERAEKKTIETTNHSKHPELRAGSKNRCQDSN